MSKAAQLFSGMLVQAFPPLSRLSIGPFSIRSSAQRGALKFLSIDNLETFLLPSYRFVSQYTFLVYHSSLENTIKLKKCHGVWRDQDLVLRKGAMSTMESALL